MRVLLPVLANLTLLISALGFGSLLVPLLDGRFAEVDRAAIRLLGGLGVLGTFLFAVGQVSFHRSAIALVLVSGAVVFLWDLAVNKKHRAFPLLKTQKIVFPFLVVLLIAIVTIVGGFSLPIGDMNHDAIAYHYLGPSVWLHEGVIRAVPHEVLTYFPPLFETEYGALMSLGGQRAPQLFSGIALLCLLLATASIASVIGLRIYGTWWCLAIVVTMPAAYVGAIYGYIDAVFASFALLAIRLVMDARVARNYALAGLFAGFCMAAKYTGLLTFAAVLVCVLFLFGSFPATFREYGRNIALFAVVAMVVASPVYIRNWFLYGSPMYPPPPALLSIFSPKNLPANVLVEVEKNVRETGEGFGRGLWDFLALPFNLTYHTSNFRGGGGIGLVPLALAPIGLWTLRKNRQVLALALFGVLSTAAWFMTAQVSRYLIPVYVIGAVLGVYGWKQVQRGSPVLARMLATLTVIVSISYGAFIIVRSRIPDVHAAVSSSFEERRQHSETPFFESFQYMNREPAVKRVLVLNCHVATYFIEKDYVKACGRWGEQLLPAPASASDAVEQARKLHATHILDVRFLGKFALADDPPGLCLVLDRQDQRVYRVE